MKKILFFPKKYKNIVLLAGLGRPGGQEPPPLPSPADAHGVICFNFKKYDFVTMFTGSTNASGGPYEAHGPRVWDPWSWVFLSYLIVLMHYCLSQVRVKPLNVINLGQGESDNTNQMLTIAGDFIKRLTLYLSKIWLIYSIVVVIYDILKKLW